MSRYPNGNLTPKPLKADVILRLFKRIKLSFYNQSIKLSTILSDPMENDDNPMNQIPDEQINTVVSAPEYSVSDQVKLLKDHFYIGDFSFETCKDDENTYEIFVTCQYLKGSLLL